MTDKSIVQEARDIQLAMELITLGARLQMLESETQLSRERAAGQPAAKRYVALFHGLVHDLGAEHPRIDVL